MAASLLQTTRYRIGFAIWWCCWAALHFFVLDSAGLPRQTALYDSVISNVLLGGFALLVSITLQYYLPGDNKYSYLCGLCAILTILWVSLDRFLLLLLLEEGSEYKSFFSQSLLIRGAAGFLITSCSALISVLWYTLQDQKEAERRRAEADRLSKEAELNNLRQQLQPHFLFNCLNSINALVGSQPQQARTMIQQLSDFLRGTLKKEQATWISLEDELQHLQLYLDIEKVRFGHRLSTTVSNKTSNVYLPAMLLQPIVENAIKFGLYDTTENVVISIAAQVHDKDLLIRVSNPFDKETVRSGTGFGLSSVQRRLYLLFARNDLLQTATHENFFITTIKIPQP